MAKSKNSHRLSIFFIVLSVGWLAALFIESSHPPLPVFEKVHGLDKVAHFFAFGVLGFLVCCVSFNTNGRQQIPLFSMPLIIASLIGIVEECYQMLIPSRASELLDLLADVSGALFAVILSNCIARIYGINNRFKQD